MKRLLFATSVLAVIVSWTLYSTLLGESHSNGKVKMSTNYAIVKLNTEPESFLSLNNLDEEGNIDKQPAGIHFYEIDWPSRSKGSVRVEHGKYSFDIQHVMSVVGSFDTERSKRGIYHYSIGGTMASQADVLHDEVRQAFLGFLTDLSELGWRSYYSLYEPRLMPSSALKYTLQEDNFYPLLLGQDFTLDQWMELKYPRWQLYADNMFIEISFKRDRSRLVPNEPSGYFFSYKIFDAHELILNQFEFNERDNAESLWATKKAQLLQQRAEKEARLIEQDYAIDALYEEPELSL